MATTTKDLERLQKAAFARSTSFASFDHGERHWKRVAQIGLALAPDTPGADRLGILLFALFHDSMRLNEFEDPGHGERGGALLAELAPQHLDIDDEVLAKAVDACARHTDGELSDDPTIGVCWDADRLDLWRVGIAPSPRYLSNPAARDPDRIAWAGGLNPDEIRWPRLFDRATGQRVPLAFRRSTGNPLRDITELIEDTVEAARREEGTDRGLSDLARDLRAEIDAPEV